MIISEEVEKIIKRRKEKIPAIRASLEKVQSFSEELRSVIGLKNDMLMNADKLNISPEVIESIERLNIESFNREFSALKQKYDEVISRFTREEINIAVVGSARQGKSMLLQSISDLDNKVIPAFESDDCTGALSVIQNVPGSELVANVSFMNEQESVVCVQKYLDSVFGKNEITIGSFSEIGELDIDKLRERIPSGAPEVTKFEHLCKYVNHFKDWSRLVRQGSKTLNDPEEIQKYVAQHNGKNEEDENRLNFFSYLAVKEVVIKCEFKNADSGKIVLRDTIGLGDTSLGIEDKMLDTIGNHSDAAIIVRRPEVGTGKFDSTDDAIYKSLYDHFSDKNMDKWLFWLTNQTAEGSIYGDNSLRCKALDKKISEKKWKLANHFIINVSDKECVNNIFCENILKTLISNIDAIDDGILSDIRKQTDILYDAYADIQRMIDEIVEIEGYSEIDLVQFLDEKWKNFYENQLMKLIKQYKEELKKKKDLDCEEFKKEIEDILDNSKTLIPEVEQLEADLTAGGHNRPHEVYGRYLDKIRNDFTEQFLRVDELIFDRQVREFKEKIIDIFAGNDGGRLANVVSVEGLSDKVEWLRVVAADLFGDTGRYAQFKTAFLMIADFELSVRGFLMHRIRSRIDKLECEGFTTCEDNDQDIALEIKRNINRKLNDVREEINDEMKEGFYKDPNRIFYAVIAEFYDRINFSYTDGDFQDVEVHWKSLYRENVNKIWQDECRENQDMSDLYNRWFDLRKALKKRGRNDFELSAKVEEK